MLVKVELEKTKSLTKAADDFSLQQAHEFWPEEPGDGKCIKGVRRGL